MCVRADDCWIQDVDMHYRTLHNYSVDKDIFLRLVTFKYLKIKILEV